MWKIRFGMLLVLLGLAGSVLADARPGTARRTFEGRTYFYEPITFYSPVWYAGNGVIATRKLPGVPLWPNAKYDVVHK